MLRRLMIPMLFLALAWLPACSDDDSNPTTLNGPSAGMSFVRVAHLSPDAPAVDVWVDGEQALAGVPFRAFSGYLELEAGEHRIQVTAAGTTEPSVIDATVTLEDGVSYTVAAVGLLGDSSLTASVLMDDRSPSSGAEVRFVHASPDAPPVDITLTDGTILFGAVPFGEADGSIPVGAGNYDLQVRAAGTATVVLSFGDVALAAGTNYTVYAIGRLGDGTLDAIVSVDAPGDGDTIADLDPANAEVRAAHLSPDAPAVDIYLDGQMVGALTGVPFKVVSGYLTVGASTHNVKVYAAGTTTNPVIDADVTLLPNRAYTVAATGLLADITPIVLEDDRTAPAAGQSHVRFVHASPDAPAVDIQVANGGPTLFTGTSFRQFAGYSQVGSGMYDLEVRLTSNDALALAVPGVQLNGSTNTTIFAIGLAGDGSLEALPVTDTP
jgi:hypothetical protein